MESRFEVTEYSQPSLTPAELEAEVNEALREGFDSIMHLWNDNAEIVPVENFKPVDGGLRADAYGLMVTLTHSEIESGEFKSRLREAARGTAKRMNEMAAEQRKVHGEHCRLRVALLHGAKYPRADVSCRVTASGYVLIADIRCYHDFGMTASPQRASQVRV